MIKASVLQVSAIGMMLTTRWAVSGLPAIMTSYSQLVPPGSIALAPEIVPMCSTVVDDSGNVVAFERIDGGKITSVTIALGKEFMAAAAKKPSANIMQ